MRVSMQDLIDRFDDVADRARIEPVTIVDCDRDRLVLLSADEYLRLKGWEAVQRHVPEREEPVGAEEMPSLWGAMKHTVTYISDDIAEPIGEVWKAER